MLQAHTIEIGNKDETLYLGNPYASSDLELERRLRNLVILDGYPD